MKKQFETYNVVLIVVLVVALGLLAFNNTITGQVVEGTSVTDVVIEKYLSIAFSPGLQGGIDFGIISELPSFETPALGNGNLSYQIFVHEDGNVPVDFCIYADGDMVSPNFDVIEVFNQLVHATPATVFDVNQSYELDTAPQLFDETIPSGNELNLGFWLDVEANTPAGSYNNTITFRGIPDGGAC